MFLFSPHYINFPILGVFLSSAPLGTRERRQVWRGWCDLLVFQWEVTGAGPQLSAGLVGVSTAPLSVLLLLMILAVSGYHCFSLCSVLSSGAFTHTCTHSFCVSASISVFLSQPLNLYSAHKSQTMNVITGDTATQ